MLKNFFLIAIRNLKRNKSYTIINVLGLAVGISGALVVATLIYYENNFNSYHTNNVTNVHRVVCEVMEQNDMHYTSTVPHPVGEELRLEFTDLEAVSMIYAMEGLQVNIKDDFGLRKFKDDLVGFADNDIFKILHFDWVTIFNPGAIKTPNSVVISTKMAAKYFNVTSDYQSIVGETIRLENQKNLIINGVFHDFPKNTDFPFELIAHYKDQEGINKYFGEGKLWGRFNGGTNCYIKLNAATSPDNYEENLNNYLAEKDIMDGLVFKLQPLKKIHFDSRYDSYAGYTFGDTIKLTLSLVGIFLLVIGCINFINLSTAQSVNRSKEVGIRKVMGSDRKSLISQFMIETLLIVLLANALALGFAELWFQLIERFMDLEIGLYAFSTLDFVLYFLLIIVFTTLLAGIYPSFVVSSFSPLEALKVRLTSRKSKGGLSLRRTLVILQFVFTQAIIIGTVIVVYQFDFLINKELGFDKEGIVSIVLPKENREKVPVFLAELERNPEIKLASTHLGSPMARTNNTSKYFWSKMGEDGLFRVNDKAIDEKYLDVFGIKLIEGQNLVVNENEKNVLVNLEAVRSMGIDNPKDAIGEELATTRGRKVIIKGVVSDFNSMSLRDEMFAIIMYYDTNDFDEVAVRLSSIDEQTRKNSIAAIEAEWDKIWPKHIIEYDFVDDALVKAYRSESVMATLFKAFSLISIIISCLGVYGLIDFMANKKQKEIGIRKVLGASILNILNIFSKEVIVLLIVSFLIACPLVYMGMTKWLESFAYQIDIEIGMLLIAFIISLILIIGTVAYRSIIASNMNPAISLKDE